MTKNTTNIGLTLTRNNQLLDDFLEDKAEERHSKYNHVLYNFFPDIRSISHRVYWGVFSWTIPDCKERWLLRNSAVRFGSFVSSHGDIVRDYLTYYHPKKLRAIGSEARDYQKHVHAPLFVTPRILKNAMYVDIGSTFWSILKNVGWNVSYKAGQWLTPGRAPLDFPLPHDKPARNYLVTIGLPKPLTIWNGYEFISEYAKNAHINRAIYLVVMDILHSIANIAVLSGAIYVHTDGYIIPERAFSTLCSYIENFGLCPEVRAIGDAYVYGIGNYMVGDKRTKSFDPLRVSREVRHIEPPNSSIWLQNTVGKIVSNHVAERLYETWNSE